MTDSDFRSFPRRTALKFDEASSAAFANRCVERVRPAFALPSGMREAKRIEDDALRPQASADRPRRELAFREGLNALDVLLRSNSETVASRRAIRTSQSVMLAAVYADRSDCFGALRQAFCAMRYSAEGPTIPLPVHHLRIAVAADISAIGRKEQILDAPLWGPVATNTLNPWPEQAEKSAMVVRNIPWPPKSTIALSQDEVPFAALCRRFLESRGYEVKSSASLGGESLVTRIVARNRAGQDVVALVKPRSEGGLGAEAVLLLAVNLAKEVAAAETIVFLGEPTTEAWRAMFAAALNIQVFDANVLESAALHVVPMESIDTICRRESGPRVSLNEVTLENYRGIERLRFSWEADAARVSFLVGANASGKSSALEAMAAVLGPASSPFRVPMPARDLRARDVRGGAKACALEALLVLDGVKHRFSRRFSIEGLPRSQSTRPVEFLERFQGLKDSGDQYNTPVMMYYSTDRFDPGYQDIGAAAIEVPARPKSRRAPKKTAKPSQSPKPSGSSFAAFQRFEGWFRAQEDFENQIRLSFPEYVNRGLEAVRHALEVVLPDLRGMRYDRALGRLMVQKGEFGLEIPQLSDGERRVALVTADIARRLTSSNPTLPNPLDGDGVILIDEVELHLHPAWQRTILGRWLEVFPGCSFVCATHSPLVIAGVRGTIHVLESFAVRDIFTSHYGSSAATVLSGVFGVDARPGDLSLRLQRIARLIDAQEIATAKQELDAMVSVLDSDDPEFVRLRTLIEYLEA